MLPRRTTSSMVAASRPMAIGTVRKMQVQMTLLVSADQNTRSANRFWKFRRPTKLGAEMPSQRKNASAMVSSAGTRMMTKLMASVGTM